ncbi:MAG: hypothetical protein M9920_12230 [Verrucomicrobiae bacterium]|nr:hypothetical protein [Verrucomicrobiae bacterium]
MKPTLLNKSAERIEKADELLRAIQRDLPKLEVMLTNLEDEWGMEDSFYRFYHQSFKVYGLQLMTIEIREAFALLLPGQPLNSWYLEIVAQGTDHEFELAHNDNWLRHTRPIVEAAFHSYFFLKQMVKYGKQLNTPPDQMPSGWAAVLYLFNLR